MASGLNVIWRHTDETFILRNVTNVCDWRIDERKPRKYATSYRIVVIIVCFLATVPIKGESKLDRLQLRVLPIKTKKVVRTNIRPEISYLFLVERKITFNNKHRNCVTFHLQLTSYIFSTCSQFKTCWFPVVYQVTVHKNAQNMLHLNECTNGHICSWNVAPFQRSRGCWEWFCRQKNAL
jgi:hypothetical protein